VLPPPPVKPVKPVKVVVPKPPPVVKKPYTCPTSSKEIITLEPTPVLDQEGKQVIDPDGKPLFNTAVKQQRDKKGYPVCTPDGKPVFQSKLDMGYDDKGKKIPIAKVKPEKERPIDITRGTFTVDGMIGKAEMNYHIPNLKYIYFYTPGIGIAVVSDEPFPGAVIQKTAFNSKTLTVMVGEHILQLASDKVILGKPGHPEPAYVLLDREFKLPSKYPVVGYGTVRDAPYAWPGSKPNAILKGLVAVPPTPKSLRPVMLLSACPTGEMRQPLPDGFAALPGAQIPDQPCVPIGGVIKGAGSTVADKGRQTGSAAPAAAPETTPADTPNTTPATGATPVAMTPGATPAAPETAPAPAPDAVSATQSATPATTTDPAPTATPPPQ
jgi:hypothetical protein